RHGTARHGTARHGTARHGTARHGTARHGTENATYLSHNNTRTNHTIFLFYTVKAQPKPRFNS
ncbi:hypothetical protein, partial [Acetobacter orientalis]|uniref:hypothetical protein n=1 Tax=Acetobacter orientalis TaxID=146474 RepID=UPI003530BFBC